MSYSNRLFIFKKAKNKTRYRITRKEPIDYLKVLFFMNVQR
jgi:hypothetical protein